MATDPTTGLLQLATPPTSSAPTSTTGGLIQQTGNAGTPTSTGPVPTTPVDPVQTFTPAQAQGVTAGATGYTPTPYQVDPKTGTVQGQLSDILSKDSPLMSLATSQADQSMNSRGLLNSSLAEGARQAAVIAQALPIAQQDASAYTTAMTNTVNAKNAASSSNAQAENNAATVNAQLLTSLNSTNANAINNALGQNVQAQNQRNLQLISSDTQISLANLQAQNQQLLQTDVNAANGFSQLIAQIAAIQNSSTLDSATKQQDVQSLVSNYNQFLKTSAAIGSTNQANVTSLNLDQYFNNPSYNQTMNGSMFPGPNGTLYPSQQAANDAWVQQGKQQQQAIDQQNTTPPAQI